MNDPIPLSWLPDATVKRIVFHWNGGGYIASELDKEHYHFMIQGDGSVVRGDFPITANHPPLREGHYAAHTKGTNSYAIGIAVCCMAQAKQEPFDTGIRPMKRIQWEMLARCNAQLAARYNLKITRESLLSHAEVQGTLGNPQDGKWDIARLSFDPSVKGAGVIGDLHREAVRKLLQ